MKESREFATAYAAAVERAPKPKKSAEAEEPEVKIEVFQSGTKPFEDALEKVSKGLLQLLDSQFRSRPQALVAGGVAAEKLEDEKRRKIEQSENKKDDSNNIEDETTVNIMEEDDAD